MMSLKDYALDVGLDLEKVKKMCDKIGISYDDEESLLSEDDIILLDNETQDEEDYISDDVSEYEEEIESIEKAEALAEAANIDLDNSENFEKVKRFYDNGIWNEARVYNAVGKWITKEEYKEITGEDYK